MYEKMTYKTLGHTRNKDRLRFTGINIPRWSYIIFKVRLKYRVDHSFVTIYEIKNSQELQRYSGYYSPKKIHMHGDSMLSSILVV